MKRKSMKYSNEKNISEKRKWQRKFSLAYEEKYEEKYV